MYIYIATRNSIINGCYAFRKCILSNDLWLTKFWPWSQWLIILVVNVVCNYVLTFLVARFYLIEAVSIMVSVQCQGKNCSWLIHDLSLWFLIILCWFSNLVHKQRPQNPQSWILDRAKNCCCQHFKMWLSSVKRTTVRLGILRVHI